MARPNYSNVNLAGAGIFNAMRNLNVNPLEPFSNFFSNVKETTQGNEDRALKLEDREFKLEDAALQRQLTNQQIGAGLLKAEQAPELFKSQQEARQAQTNAANQRANTGAYNLGQTKADNAREAKLRGDKAAWANQRLALGDDNLGTEDVSNQFMNMYQQRGMSPEMINFQNTLENAVSAPTNAQTARTKQEEILRKEALKTEESRLDRESKENAARIKAGGKSKSPLVKSNLISNIKRTDLDAYNNFETDAESGSLASNYVYDALQNYKGKKLNQAALDNIVTGSIRAAGVGSLIGGDKDYFDSSVFDNLLKQYFQVNTK